MKIEKSTAQNYLIPVMIRHQVHPSTGTQTDSSYRFWVYPIPYRLATRTSCAWREGIEIGWIEAYGYPNVQVFGDHISRGTNYALGAIYVLLLTDGDGIRGRIHS